MTMLITHVKPESLWGKKDFDTKGRFLGDVVAIASRRGVLRKIVVRRARHDEAVRLILPADTNVEGNVVTLPSHAPGVRGRLRLVQ